MGLNSTVLQDYVSHAGAADTVGHSIPWITNLSHGDITFLLKEERNLDLYEELLSMITEAKKSVYDHRC